MSGDLREHVVDRLSSVWHDYQSSIHDQLELMEHVAGRIDAGAALGGEIAEAVSAAHRLAGGLGIFGLTAASDICIALEYGFERAASNTPMLVQELRASIERGSRS